MKRFLKLYILMLFSVTANHIFAQRVEWAFHVDSVSSEYSPDRHAAKEVLGVPNVDRRGRNSIYAWAVEPNVLDKEGVEVAFIQVSFKKVSDATQLAVFESFNPGAIALIEIKDEKNNWKTVYVDSLVIARTGFGTFVTSEKEYDREREFDNNQENFKNIKKRLGSIQREWKKLYQLPDSLHKSKGGYTILRVKFDKQKVQSVRVIINPLAVDGWNQIDAIGITADNSPIKYPVVETIREELFIDDFGSPLSQSINTQASEIQPVLSYDSKILYFTRSDAKSNYYKSSQDIYFSKLQEDNAIVYCKDCPPKKRNLEYWSTPEILQKPFNNVFPNAVMGFAENGNKMYLTNDYSSSKHDCEGCDSAFMYKNDGLSVAKLIHIKWAKIDTSETNKLDPADFGMYTNFYRNPKNNTLICSPIDSGYQEDANQVIYVAFKKGEKWKTPIYAGHTSDEKLIIKPPKFNGDNDYLMKFDTLITGNSKTIQISNIFWSYPEPVRITGYENLSKYVNFNINSDGNVMLISMQGKDSYGDRDIYISFRAPDSSWTRPKNLGNVINTISEDCSPFLDDDNKTLYFSSAGHNGFGDRDIYISKRLDDTWLNWTKPLNVGTRINTPNSEADFTISPKSRVAYYSTTENMDCSEKSDIFQIRTLQPLTILFTGTVWDYDNKKRIGAELNLKSIQNGHMDGFSKAKFFSDSRTGEYNVELTELIEGNKIKDFALTTTKDRYLQSDSLGHLIKFIHLDLAGHKRYISINRDLYMRTKDRSSDTNTVSIDITEAENNIKPNTLNPDQLADIIRNDKQKIEPKDTVKQKDPTIVQEVGGYILRKDKCSAIFHEGNLYFIEPVAQENYIAEFQYLVVDYSKDFGYNQKDISVEDSSFQKLMIKIRHDLEELKKLPETYRIKVHIVSSASKIPTNVFKSNQDLSEARASEAERRIRELLTKDELTKIKFTQQNLVDGEKTEKNEIENKKFQFVKIWIITCNQGDK